MTKSLQMKKSIDNIWPMSDKKVLMRVDFNVPIKKSTIQNDYRIRSALPSIKAIIDNGGKLILMSHLGRPGGIKYTKSQRDEWVRRKALQTWALEAGTGKTTFFAVLSGVNKKNILSWSSKKEEAGNLSEAEGSGKTDLFSSLDEKEKKILLDRYNSEGKSQEVQFPHLGQNGGFDMELSLKPVAARLEELLNDDTERTHKVKVIFAEDCLDAQHYVDELKAGQVLLLENVRFYSDESSKDEKDRLEMARQISSYGDVFISDAFGTAHRNSATMTGIPKVMGHGAAGYLMSAEINYFSKVLGSPARPMVAIVGGAKVSDKIVLLENLLTHIDVLVIGGAMAYTFLHAQGIKIGNSFHQAGQSYIDKNGEKQNIDSLASILLEKAREKNIKVALPLDHICHTKCEMTNSPLVSEDANVPDGYMALDIGPKTIESYKSIIAECNTAIWNGPMGVFEIPTYAAGTFAIAKAMGDGTQDRGMMSIIGGGDSASAAEMSGEAKRMSHVSTGGGASLELLEGKILPGIDVLDDLETMA